MTRQFRTWAVIGLVAFVGVMVAIGCKKDSDWEYRKKESWTGVERLRAIESRVAKLESRPPTILINRPPRAFEPLPGVRR
jgi:hypothetical protein